MFKTILRGIADLLLYVVFAPIKILAALYLGAYLLYAWIKYDKDLMIECWEVTKEKMIETLKAEWNWIKTGEV